MIKKTLVNFLPHGLYLYLRKKKNSNHFLDGFHNFKKRNYSIDFNTIPDEKFKYIVSVQGLGFSGSGAVLDLLCEVKDCVVLGTNENVKTLGIDHKGEFEVDFVRFAGGLFEIEKFIDSSNIYHNDALVNRFVKCMNSFPFLFKDIRIGKYIYHFFDELLDFELRGIKGAPYNSYLYDKKDINSIFFLRKINVRDFREKCKYLLVNIFNQFSKSKEDIIVLDQFLGDMTFNMEMYTDYLPKNKMILCYRDPRDVYTFACEHNISWIAHSNADSFIKWFKIMTANVDLDTNKYLIVQFEQLIMDYSYQKNRILEYLELPIENHHISKKKYFMPEISKQNIGIWKYNYKLMDDNKKIATQLGEYCYFA